jgi:hypothetical protein
MERSKAGVLESLNVITPLTVREGTRGADFGGVPPLCNGGGHLRQKKVSPATKWDTIQPPTTTITAITTHLQLVNLVPIGAPEVHSGILGLTTVPFPSAVIFDEPAVVASASCSEQSTLHQYHIHHITSRQLTVMHKQHPIPPPPLYPPSNTTFSPSKKNTASPPGRLNTAFVHVKGPSNTPLNVSITGPMAEQLMDSGAKTPV